jgi:integrase
MKLWPKPVVRPIRFHDLPHTTATLLLRSGVPLVVVQKVLRHRDPKLTEAVYGHLATDYLRRGESAEARGNAGVASTPGR